MSEWKTYKLGDICLKVTDGSHFSPKENLLGEKLIASVKDMNNNGIYFHKCKKITKEDFDTLVKNDCQPLKGDVLFSKDGTMGIVYYCKEELDLVLLSSIAILRPNNKIIDGNYLAYYLKNPQTNQDVQDNYKSGSALPRIVLKDFKKLEVTIPESLETQTQIAQILTSLDDKIELNLQMNQTLEAMAQALFKEWFVKFNFPKCLNRDSLDLLDEQDFEKEKENQKEKKQGNQDNPKNQGSDNLPKGWKECSMRDFGKIICGKTPSKAVDEYFGGEYMFIKIPDMHNSVFIIETTDSLTELGLNSQSNKTIPPYSICISSIATVGLVCINPEPCQTNQQINTIVPKNSFLKYYLYFLAISMKKTFLATASGGTATLNMNTSQFSNLNIIMPSDNVLEEFDKIVSPIMAKILENYYFNQTLTQTRDTLLPKLMSGKIAIV